MTFTLDAIAQNSQRSLNHPKVSEADMRQAVRALLIGLREDPDFEGLMDTPKRVVKALKFLTSGYLNRSMSHSTGLFLAKITMKWCWFAILICLVPVSTIFYLF